MRSLKYFFSSGEILDGHSVNRFNAIFRNYELVKLVNLYGPTEATIDVSYYICSRNEIYDHVPIGRPINNINLFVMDDNLKVALLNQPGELYISGVGLAKGYLHKRELTEGCFIEQQPSH